jgi:hypothetical protein
VVTLRRFLVLAVLMFWQGGFTFYAAVVVRVGTEELGPLGQGFITRQVTNYLNAAGALALLVLAWDVIATADSSVPRRFGRWLTALAMAIGLVLLVVLHFSLESQLDVPNHDIRERATFLPLHRLYLWISTLQWACALAHAVLTIQAWRTEDEARANMQGQEPQNTTQLGESGELDVENEPVPRYEGGEIREGVVGGKKKVPSLTPSASPSHRSRHTTEHENCTTRI